MRRFWLDQKLSLGDALSLTGELFHHIRDVCRFGVGDHFELLTGDQKAYFVEVKALQKKSLDVVVLEERALPALPRPNICLAVSIPRFSTFETIIEKSCELGVHTLQPYFSDYSFVRDSSKIPPAKWERWQKILRGAAQQSGRGQLMELAKPLELKELLKTFNRKPKVGGLFPYEGEASFGVKPALESIKGAEDLDEFWVFVGSEGGFSLQEVAEFKSSGLEPASLGPQVLRVETACVALVSVIKYQFNLMA